MGHLVLNDIILGNPAWKCCLDTAVMFLAAICAMGHARALELGQ